MNDFKEIINLNIEKAENRKNACIKKTPDDISSIRYWEGYVTALNSIVSLFPNEVEHEQETLFSSDNNSSTERS